MVDRLQHGHIADERGSLMVWEYPAGLPFRPVRCFVVKDVPPGQSRGDHGHRTCEVFLVMLVGSCEVELWDSPSSSTTVKLCEGEPGLLLSPGTFSRQRMFSPDAVLLALASEVYDTDEYVTREEFFGAGGLSGGAG